MAGRQWQAHWNPGRAAWAVTATGTSWQATVLLSGPLLSSCKHAFVGPGKRPVSMKICLSASCVEGRPAAQNLKSDLPPKHASELSTFAHGQLAA